MTEEEKNIQIGSGILKAVNEKDYDILDEVMAPDFLDHHYGFSNNLTSREEYKQALAYAHKMLDIKGTIDVIFSKGDRLINRVTIKGKHIGPFLGIAPTGKEVEWTTIEVYRIENGKIKERFAIDDMFGLLAQLNVEIPS